MLTHQSVVMEFESFSLAKHPVIVTEISVRGADYQDTLLFKPPFPLH